MTTLPPNDVRAELPRATPFRHTLAGLVVLLEAEPVAFFLEHAASEAEALELAAAEAIAPRCRLHVERRECSLALFEGDRHVDAWGSDAPIGDVDARVLGAQLVACWILRHRAPARRSWSRVTR